MSFSFLFLSFNLFLPFIIPRLREQGKNTRERHRLALVLTRDPRPPGEFLSLFLSIVYLFPFQEPLKINSIYSLDPQLCSILIYLQNITFRHSIEGWLSVISETDLIQKNSGVKVLKTPGGKIIYNRFLKR